MSRPISTKSFVFAAFFFSLACSSEIAESPTSPLTSAATLDKTPYDVGVDSVRLQPGDTHQLEATKAANGKSVPGPSIAWSSSDPAVASVSSAGLVTALSYGRAVVSAKRGDHTVDVVVNVGCAVGVLPVGVTQGEITPDDCLFTFAGRRSDYYSVASTNGEVIGILSTGVRGITGIKEATLNPHVGTVFGSRNVGARYRVISNGDPLQFYISGFDGTYFGEYTITRSVDAQAHSCNQITHVVPGATFSTSLQPANSCAYNIQYSPFPEVIGKPINTHRYWAKLEAKQYTITISGLTDSFNPAVTIFPNIAGAGPIAQSIDGTPAAASRTVTFAAPGAGYYLVEISAGRFVDGSWAVQSGPFTLSVSR